MQAIITVDPGVFTLGACLWNAHDFNHAKKIAFPIQIRCYDMKQSERIEVNKCCHELASHLIPWFNGYDVQLIAVEKPIMFPSAVGFAAAAKSHLQNMEIMRGCIYSIADEYRSTFIDILVNDWKGNMPKDLVNRRIVKIYKEAKQKCKLSANRSHDWDAAGIGFHLQGIF